MKALTTPSLLQTLKSRPALVLNTWDKVALQCLRPWRGLSNSAISSMECLKHQGDLSLNYWCLAPRLRRGLLQQRRIVLRVSRNAKHREGSKPPIGSLPP